jgi:5'(3')-deoxyribonucleotidase
MMRRKIALDMDGVLSDSWKCFIDSYNTKYKTGFSLRDFNSHDREKIFGKPIDELEKDVDNFYDTNGCFNIPPLDGAIDGVR